MTHKTSLASSKSAPKWASLIGIPYSVQDCWGICRSFYQLEFGIELKSYYDIVPNDHERARDLISSSRGDFYRVDQPRFGDIMTLKLMGLECHLGIFLDDSTFLHTQKLAGCMIDRQHRWRQSITGHWRVLGMNSE